MSDNSDDQFDPISALKAILDRSVEQKYSEARKKMLANLPFIAVLLAAVIVAYVYSPNQFSFPVFLLQIVSAVFVLLQIALFKDFLHYRSAVRTKKKLERIQKMILNNQMSEEMLDTPLKHFK